MNKVILYGNCGKDPESKQINGKTVTKFSLATNKTYTDAAGQKITDTCWHNIVLWGKVAEMASKYVKKGSSIIIEGEISYRNYENKEGQTVYITEIIGHNMHFAGSKPEEKPKSTAMSDINELPQSVRDAEDVPDDEPPFV